MSLKDVNVSDIKKAAAEGKGKTNVGKEVSNAMKALEGMAFQTTKGFLTGITQSINGAVAQLNDVSKNLGAVFHRPRKGNDIELPKFEWGNEYPVIFGGYGVTINGKELGVERLAFITDLEICQNVGVDTCSFTVVDPNFYFIEDNIYIRNTPIQTSITLIGVPAKDVPKISFDGYISNIDIDFPSEGAPIVKVYCVDKTHEMNRKRWKRSWENVNSAQVVQIIAQEMGYQCYIEPDYPFPIQATIIQDMKTNIEFLEELAGKELDLFVVDLITNADGKTILYYVIKGHIDEENYISLGYMVSNHRAKGLKDKDKMQYDVISFSPRLNMEQRQEEVQSDGVNSDTKEIETNVESVPEAVEDTSNNASNNQNSGGGGSSNSDPLDQTV